MYRTDNTRGRVETHTGRPHRPGVFWSRLITAVIAVLILCPGQAVEAFPSGDPDRPSLALPRAPHLGPTPPLGKGKFLVASLGLMDPNFAETVVLLLEYGDRGATGLVINRPTDIRLSELFPEIEPLQGRELAVFVGGPVERGQLMMLLRSDETVEKARRVFNDVFMSASRTVLSRLAEGQGESFRVYAGYAGWAPGQLDREVREGGWHVLPGDPDILFDENPSGVWPALIQRSSLHWVRLQD